MSTENPTIYEDSGYIIKAKYERLKKAQCEKKKTIQSNKVIEECDMIANTVYYNMNRCPEV